MSNPGSENNVNVGRDVTGVGAYKIQESTIHQTFIYQQPPENIHQRPLILGCPYLGLEKFKPEDKDKFFGRDEFIKKLLTHLEQHNLLLLLGQSGSGKSSLIQAGVIPQLTDKPGLEGFINLTFVPDENPFESLYGRLLSRYPQSQAKLAREEAAETLIKVVNNLKKIGVVAVYRSV